MFYFGAAIPKVMRGIQIAALTAIVNESPAFMADFLPGDILIRFNNIEITNNTLLHERISENKGRHVVIDLIRDGELLSKGVKLN